MMKKIFGITLLIVLFLFTGLPQAFAGWDHYQITVYRDKGFSTGPTGHELITSGVQYMVIQAGTQGTLVDIYSDKGITSMTNPVTATVFNTKDKIDFYVDDSTYTSVDIAVVDNQGGFHLYLDGVTEILHTAVINELPGIQHHGMIWYTVSCSSTKPADLDGGAYDTGIDILAGSLIDDLIVEVVSETVTSDILMAVGLGATNQGLIQAAVTDRLTGATLGGQFMYYSDQSEYFVGSLMDATYSSDAESGTAVVPKGKYMVLTDASLTYSFESADEVTSDNFDSAGYGFIHFFFTPARVW